MPKYFSTKSTADINNIVAQLYIDQEFDMQKLSEYIEAKYKNNTEYEVKIQIDKPPIQIVIKTENYTILIFRNGKFRIMGVKTIANLKKAKTDVQDICDTVALSDFDLELDVLNIVANDTIDADKNIKIREIAKDIKNENVNVDIEGEFIYEPERFQALEYKYNEDINVTIYYTGDMIISGCTDIDQIHNITRNVKESIHNILVNNQ